MFFTGLYSTNARGNCIVNKAAIVMSPLSAKLKVAKVDDCKKVIVTVVVQYKRGLNFRDALAAKQQIPGETISEISETLALLKEIAVSHNADDFAGVVTGDFRQAKNAKLLMDLWNSSLGLNLRMIDSLEEAQLGYLGAKQHTIHPDNYVTWSINSNRMHFSTEIKDEFTTYQTYLGSQNFYDSVLKQASESQSWDRAVQSHMTKIISDVPKQMSGDLKAKISTSMVFGIGGFHRYSMASYAGAKSWTTRDLEKLLNNAIGPEASAIALVLGHMKSLGIHRVHSLKSGIADGVLLR